MKKFLLFLVCVEARAFHESARTIERLDLLYNSHCSNLFQVNVPELALFAVSASALRLVTLVSSMELAPTLVRQLASVNVAPLAFVGTRANQPMLLYGERAALVVTARNHFAVHKFRRLRANALWMVVVAFLAIGTAAAKPFFELGTNGLRWLDNLFRFDNRFRFWVFLKT